MAISKYLENYGVQRREDKKKLLLDAMKISIEFMIKCIFFYFLGKQSLLAVKDSNKRYK